MTHKFQGRVWKFGNDINTDLMYPQICYSRPEAERPKFTMWANRPDWAGKVSERDILVAGRNFGVGSSRPAASNLKGLGLGCVLAETVNGLFLRNSVNVGFPTVSCPGIHDFVDEGQEIRVDLDSGTVVREDGKELRFDPLPGFLMEIIDSGGIIEILRKKGMLEENPL